ncbi:MAG: transglycosylase domain-containing protein [Pseudomonadota bacterium]
MDKRRRHIIGILAGLLTAGAVLVGAATFAGLAPLSDLATTGVVIKPQLLDRHGRPITVTYENRWNLNDQVAFHQIPALLRNAFVFSEDRRFFTHGGVDWLARLSACRQNLLAGRAVRGASTITEQVVRLMHPRPRTLWSRWLEGFDAMRLEARQSKAAILECYLNQVPYDARRRGVLQAARYYFDRDLATLSAKETLALAVMVRAPARLTVLTAPAVVDRAVKRLAVRLREAGALSETQWADIAAAGFSPVAPAPPVDARHFAQWVTRQEGAAAPTVRTTLDLDVQRIGQQVLDRQLAVLSDRRVQNGALLVVDHRENAVLAWVVGRAGQADAMAAEFDAVRTPRQPGSTLKPFVYALAISREWTPATMIDDSPLSESVGTGLHTYRNYSRVHYGPVSLRAAMANSLNIPAVKAVQYVGPVDFLAALHELGIDSLDRHPDVYGDGLALGNGEITLFELVQAYTVLARGGLYTPLSVRLAPSPWPDGRRVFSEAVASLMGHMLSDPDARRWEFGESSILNLPVQTAVKTGTSSDYRDAWAVGYNYRYTVGVWMGNLDSRPMDELTGSIGPALVMRSVFAELMRDQPALPLPLSRHLVRRAVCIDSGLLADGACDSRQEWFVPGKLPAPHVPAAAPVRIRRPGNGLQMAQDPRIPDELEAFEFQLNRRAGIRRVDWRLDGRLLASTAAPDYVWALRRGTHRLQARVWGPEERAPEETPVVRFVVK